jgi:Uma2 family endonuclease
MSMMTTPGLGEYGDSSGDRGTGDGRDGPRRPAGYQDVLDAPDNMVAEVVRGELFLSSRPAPPHANAASVLGDLLGPPFRLGRGGPGGWIIVDEPELHLIEDIVVPDLAGWRRTTMDHVQLQPAYFETRPDWVCEILSPSTAKLDRTQKLGVYARAGVGHVWLIDPIARFVEVLVREPQHEFGAGATGPGALGEGRWSIAASLGDPECVQLEPFAAVELELCLLWADVR